MRFSRRSVLASPLLLAACQTRDEAYRVRSVVPESPGSASPVWGPPYSQAELDDAQRRFGLAFPPDLVALLRTHRIAQGYDWTRDDAAIRQALDWPLDGLLFDLEHNALWWPEWGPRPATAEARAQVLRDVVAAAPKLIPLFGHRYIPETPHAAGNPVFSVYQADVIYYGRDLADWVQHEFFARSRQGPAGPFRTIPFWSEMVERNGAPA